VPAEQLTSSSADKATGKNCLPNFTPAAALR
jgi:hypothetical protein